MSRLKPITIAGGGLAGLTLGIGLRQRGVPVLIREAGHYPRHRVCGEFISGRGQDVLARLGLKAPLLQAGATTAQSAMFFLGKANSPARRLGQPALCVSRFTLDAMLAERFRRAGGELLEGERCPPSPLGEGFVRATGRRLPESGHRCGWFGLKIHARNVALNADLEMHGSPNGYVGLCRLPNDEINVCGLLRRRESVGTRSTASAFVEVGDAVERVPTKWEPLLRGRPGSALYQRLERASFDEASFCAVAALSLQPQRAADLEECCLGDAITLIPPVTGNGMSIAFESAEFAIEPLAAWSQGTISWARTQQLVAAACDRAFSRRLAWARWLHQLMFLPSITRFPGSLALRSAYFWHLLFARTR